VPDLVFKCCFGWSVQTGAVVSCIIATIIFLVKEAGKAMDLFCQNIRFCNDRTNALRGLPDGSSVGGSGREKPFFPDHIDELVILTIVGGTVGGYISFAGHTVYWMPAFQAKKIANSIEGFGLGYTPCIADAHYSIYCGFGYRVEGNSIGE